MDARSCSDHYPAVQTCDSAYFCGVAFARQTTLGIRVQGVRQARRESNLYQSRFLDACNPATPPPPRSANHQPAQPAASFHYKSNTNRELTFQSVQPKPRVRTMIGSKLWTCSVAVSEREAARAATEFEERAATAYTTRP